MLSLIIDKPIRFLLLFTFLIFLVSCYRHETIEDKGDEITFRFYVQNNQLYEDFKTNSSLKPFYENLATQPTCFMPQMHCALATNKNQKFIIDNILCQPYSITLGENNILSHLYINQTTDYRMNFSKNFPVFQTAFGLGLTVHEIAVVGEDLECMIHGHFTRALRE